MPNTTITNEMIRHTVMAPMKAKDSDLEMARFLKVTRFSVCKVRKELPNENSGDELATTQKRKQHYQLSDHSLGTPEFVRRVHGMVDKNRTKSMPHIMLNIFKCLKEQ
ncbi:unnamed protein product [Hymenolepis diminuta]|uniref:Uncharacterized protein n=1 Tax=Hymenolepis diminuta TaxID=6216 RepID=A0A564XZJ7_HYMDI|nr:unnamed protein product [Hymenolepis diminuta]